MAFRTKKISQMDPKGANLASTDLLEISELVSGSYVTKSITGAEIVASVPPTVTSWGTITGTLSTQTDLQTALNAKQATISLTTTGTGAATFVSNVLNVPTPAAATFTSLTTTGTSGASTLTAGVLNVPTYSLAGLGGVPTSRTLTINGTTQDLSADRTFTISTGITIGTTAITSGTVGRVLFEGTGNVVSESANLFWDNTNGRLGVGTSSPAQKLDINGNTQITGNLIFPAGERLIQYGASSFFAGRDAAGVYLAYGFGSQQIDIGSASTGNIRLRTTANVILDQTTSKLLIGTSTDAGFKLDVNGTAIFRSNITLNSNALYIGANSAMTLSTANSDIYLTNGNTSRKIIFDLTGSGQFQFNNGNVLVGTTSNIVSSKLTIESTTQGFLCPRMTTTQKNAIASPAAGLMVYDTTLNKLCVYTTAWETITSI